MRIMRLGAMQMRRTVAILIFGVSVLSGSGVGGAAREESKKAGEFWTADRVHTIQIRITQQQWVRIQPTRKQTLQRLDASGMARPTTQTTTTPVMTAHTQPAQHREGERLPPNFYGYEFAYAKAEFECDGESLKDVGFRLRGNSSYSASASGFKRPYKVDFNRFVDGQKFQGLTSFFLNNNAYDPSMLRETLAYEVFRKLGVPAPRTTLAMVYLSIEGRLEREYIGVYTLIEDIDTKAFLKSHFGSAKGMLLKPWSIRGLPYMGEQWGAYESRYNPRSEPTPEAAKRTIEFIKLVNYANDETFGRQIGGYLNVDEFLRLLAGDVMLANLDTFLFTGHNFYMYLNPEDNRFYLMPWDMNLSFANFSSAATVGQHLHLSIMRPHSGEMKLIDRLLAIPQYNAMYRGHIKGFMGTFFNAENFSARIDAMQAVIAKADTMAEEAWKAKYATTQPTTRAVRIPPRPVASQTGWNGGPAIGLKAFVTARIESLNAQLAGETEGFVPGYHRPPTPPAGGLRANALYGNLPATAAVVMRGADGNYDSKLTRAELKGAIRGFFADADTSRQNWLDEAKLTQAFVRGLQQVQAQRRNDRGERRVANRPGEPAALWASVVIRAVDVEKSGRVTPEQMLSASDRAFDGADKDNSGKVDESELLQALDSMAAAAPPPVVATTRPATNPAK